MIPNTFFYIIFIIANLVEAKWNLIVVLTCILIITKNVEHLFIYLQAVCISSLEKCSNSMIFLNYVLCVFIIELLEFLYILDRVSYQIYIKRFLTFCELPFHFLDDSINCNEVQFIYFSVGMLLELYLKSLSCSKSGGFMPVFSSKAFILLDPTFQSLVYFKLTFVYPVRDSPTSFFFFGMKISHCFSIIY